MARWITQMTMDWMNNVMKGNTAKTEIPAAVHRIAPMGPPVRCAIIQLITDLFVRAVVSGTDVAMERQMLVKSVTTEKPVRWACARVQGIAVTKGDHPGLMMCVGAHRHANSPRVVTE
ncbi:hypothetical protein COU80_05880 [Candidatus Peregrinibacteria bacterium CG10_big_fil_rev_8_21_14_0_10_55_24]|nr:MAG: hypothetical protein COU80_05880 [Candidatus Peregrinibacteria bacterium CG10_big_fil_rev_8_21_14_0_10_55_24]